MLARHDRAEIATAVRETLSRCGHGCTDISTVDISTDEVLLRRVLVLFDLDLEARRSGAEGSRQ